MLRHLFEAGVARCHPREVLPAVLPKDAPAGRNIVLGAGKAAAEMAAVAHECLAGETIGLVVTRYGHRARTSTGNIEVIEAGHPVPDGQSVSAAATMLELAASASPGDRVLFMMSGGGSALLCAPIDGIPVEKKQEVTKFLLHSGARIDEINCVRKHLSKIKGGGLASKAAAAECLTYVISDVVGDDPSDVASGPSIGVTSDADTAVRILRKFGYADLDTVAESIRSNTRQPAPAHPVNVVATAKNALAAISDAAGKAGWQPVVIGDEIEGIAGEVGREHAELALGYRNKGGRYALISGGELTVRVSNPNGRGGPNLEYLASLMIHLDGSAGIEAIACDSDGIDGSEDNAGGYVSWSSLERAGRVGLDPEALLAANDTYACFDALGDLVITGPTRTNINDIRIILVESDGGLGRSG
ncbi:MAG: DUF4147 domain-containing protein [Woeseiaceae bacterium]|nr:DUF4147 domain-containing protein [Woeseiaceae bacterium]